MSGFSQDFMVQCVERKRVSGLAVDCRLTTGRSVGGGFTAVSNLLKTNPTHGICPHSGAESVTGL